jgi:DtxR family Mn-dependent transcriptional regulator
MQTISHAMQDYLKTIYELQEVGERVTNSAIAQWLGIAPASVTHMMKRLAKLELVNHEPYSGFKLTLRGKRLALKIVRNHRLIEVFLTEVLDIPWDRVHTEAHQLEHAISEYLADRMASHLEDPVVDPHGRPIPARNGKVDRQTIKKLAAIKPGQLALIASVDDENPELLRYLGQLGLYPNTTVKVLAHEPFGGPLKVQVDGNERTLGVKAAEHIWVRVP